MSVQIVVTITDDVSAGEAHRRLIEAIDRAGFREWSSYVADPPLPDPPQVGFP